MDLSKVLLEKLKENKNIDLELGEINAYALSLNVSKDEITKAVKNLVEEGYLLKKAGKSKEFFLPERRGYVRGRVITKKSGRMFLRPDNGADDFEIMASKTLGALNNDIVIAKAASSYKTFRRDMQNGFVEVAAIVKRGLKTVVGTFSKNGSLCYVRPLDECIKTDIFIPGTSSANAKVGQLVNVKITKYGEAGKMASGEILEILGYPNEAGVDVLAVAREHGLTENFPESVIEEAQTLPESVDRKKYKSRRYFNENIITIDGEDTRDIDDAISLEKEGENYRLFVHIADVSAYVQDGSELDKEAFARGTSVYFPNFVIPMFPIKLSNGICSLFEGVDRLALTCEMLIDKNGKIKEYDVYESVINSNHRMTYNEVQKIIDGDEEMCSKYADVAPMIYDMNDLGKLLYKMREKRGALDFKIDEAYIKVDEKGRTVDITKRPHGDSEKIIESFMIAANESVADKFRVADMPFVYRIHENPNEIKVKRFAEWCSGFGEKFVIKGDLDNYDFQEFLRRMDTKEYGPILDRLALRTMQKARYSDHNCGHFGLGSECYCHFTSPIRRYPDLAVHRLIHLALSGELYLKDMDELNKFAFETAEQSSERERNADDAEREVDDMKKAEYMQKFVGKEFEGIISGITEYGIFVELDNTCEGMINYLDLDGNWKFDEIRQIVTGPLGTFRFGKKVKVKLTKADPASKEIDFELVNFINKEKTFNKVNLKRSNQEKTFSKKNQKNSTNCL